MADISTITLPDGNVYNLKDSAVSSWAKALTKPTYTASEVGALPDNTIIPAGTFVIHMEYNWESSSSYIYSNYLLQTSYYEIKEAYHAGKTLVVEAPIIENQRGTFGSDSFEYFTLSKMRYDEYHNWIDLMFIEKSGSKGIYIRAAEDTEQNNFKVFPIIFEASFNSNNQLQCSCRFIDAWNTWMYYQGQSYIKYFGGHIIPIDFSADWENYLSITMKFIYNNRIVYYDGFDRGSGLQDLVLDFNSSSTPDWNQDSEWGFGYIKNRTHWREESLSGMIIQDQLTIETAGGTVNLNNRWTQLNSGDIVIVYLNGERYEIEVDYLNGNIILDGGDFTLTTSSETGNPWVFSHVNAGTYSLDVSKQLSVIYHKLDKRYLDLSDIPTGGNTIEITDDSAGTVTMSIVSV